MKQLQMIAVLVLSTVMIYSCDSSIGTESKLPKCPGSYNKGTWTNCFGTTILLEGITPSNAGNKYSGEFKNGKPHGQGTLTNPDGKYTYVGGWRNGESHGQSTFTWADGEKYVGEWKNDKKHGQGTYIWADGDKYVGGWKDGKKHGQGTVTKASGKALKNGNNIESDNKLYKNITTKLFCENYYSHVKTSFNSAIGDILGRRDLIDKGGYPYYIDQTCSDYEKSIPTFLNKLHVWGFGPKYYKGTQNRRSGFMLVQETSDKERVKINHFRLMGTLNYFEHYKGAPKLVSIPLKVTYGTLSKDGNVMACQQDYLQPSHFIYSEFKLLRTYIGTASMIESNQNRVLYTLIYANLERHGKFNQFWYGTNSSVSEFKSMIQAAYDGFENKLSKKRFYMKIHDSLFFKGEIENDPSIIKKGKKFLQSEKCVQNIKQLRKRWTAIN